MNEAETRAELIDPALAAAGWGVVQESRIRREFPITQGRLLGQRRRSKPLDADYVLIYKNEKLGIIEAKARHKYYTEGVGQAKDYAERLQVRFTYSTNGDKIYSIDMETGAEGDVDAFPTPDELWERTFTKPITIKEQIITDWRKQFHTIPFEDRGGTWQPRYYQENAINNTLDAVAKGKDRILLTLATGTGKTAISFQIAWKLFQSRWNLSAQTDDYHPRMPRILFLADRNILADQAFNAFNAFEDDALVRIRPSEIKKKGRVPKNGSIFFTIFQTFMSGPNDTAYFGEYPQDFFDFIIIDECHRGGANDESSWRAIMEYFSPAVQLGLTATPRRDVNGDTYNYFGDPVYIYSLKEGINDGFLTPFRLKEFDTTIDSYQFTEDDEVISGEIDVDREYTEADFNAIIEIKEREEYRVKLFMDLINQNQKTLVFCATQIHAAAIRDLINQYSTSTNPNYCHRVTADDGGIGEQHLRDFQDNEKNIPTVLTTSKKLSTGVDAPEVRNIVLLREVKSMVEFKQIVGRGTRLFDGKEFFTIYDFVKAHKHFKDEEWDGEPMEPEPTQPRPPKKPCSNCGMQPCICIKEPEAPCYECGNDPCVCDKPSRKIIKVKLADHKVRALDSMVKTSFYSPDGKPISAAEFVKQLFGDIPSLFKNEEELRKIWSLPDTRRKLIEELSERGYTTAQLEDLKEVIHGQDSDLYDVLSYIAYQKELIPRLNRAERAKVYLTSYSPEQQEFLNFVLEQYVASGVDELDDGKLGELLILKYHAIADAKSKLGDIPSIRNAFINFQEYLYSKDVV
ncbi:MAG: DEAD/DEAH box helicase family protein [Bacteroidota bacterium]|nr:DEAD/DEAH box helicase family protein [Bacteroidota bacterium]MEE3147547.1 DEAD/DEAH box helicase family protein [Bacteroidota bacterium]